MEMNVNDFITIFGYVLTPITGVVTYFATKKQKDNNFLSDLQGSINLLADKNAEQVKEILVLREKSLQNSQEVIKVKNENLCLIEKINSLEKHNAKLTSQISDLEKKVESLKTIKKSNNGK